jgi:glycosyltransferase involved in cell wall biosynthesis
MTFLVSILIPAYNAERWIGDTIRSALAQTWPRTEIIVVDDGSRDRTLMIAQQFASRGVSVVTQGNQGAAAARNKALALSQGDYIQWLDSDDLLSPDKIERQMEVALAHGISELTLLSAPWAYFRYRTKVAKFRHTPLCCDLSPVEWFVRRWEHNLHMQTATWLISRELTEMAGPWDRRLLSNDDGEYFCRVIKASEGIKFVPDAKVFYRITRSSRLSYVGGSTKKLEAQLLGVQLQMAHLLSLEDSARTRSACLRKLQTWIGNFYPQKPELISRVEQMALSLGGGLELPPRLSWKYAWIQTLFGWTTARKVRRHYNEVKSAVARFYDATLFCMESLVSRSKRISGSTMKSA